MLRIVLLLRGPPPRIMRCHQQLTLKNRRADGFLNACRRQARMLIGGADVSGSKTGGQQNHAALVVGKEDAINRIYNSIGISPIHMSELSEHRRCQVYDRLDFSSNDVIVWCFHVSRHHAVNSMKERVASGKKPKAQDQHPQKLRFVLVSTVQGRAHGFCSQLSGRSFGHHH